jgi:hypothetical protein
MPTGRPDEKPERTLNVGAAILGWLVPGLGQIALGERRRGVYAMIGVLILFFGGLLIGGLDAVDRDEDFLWFIGQAATGPIAFGASWANDTLIKSGRFGELLPTPLSQMQMLTGVAGAQVSSLKGLAHANEFGTLFCFLAGLMNFVVVLDAASRPKAEPTRDRRASDAGRTA